MKNFQALLTAFAAAGMLTFTVGCQPPVNDAPDVSTGDIVEVDEAGSNTTLAVETPESDMAAEAVVEETPGSETP